MGDQSQIPIYAPLFDYLERNGVHLFASGSADRGLLLRSALEFLALLESRNVQVLGIEPWRKEGGGYRCDALGPWEYGSPAAMLTLPNKPGSTSTGWNCKLRTLSRCNTADRVMTALARSGHPAAPMSRH